MHGRMLRLALAAAGLFAILGAVVAFASPSLPINAPTPRSADQMTNIDVLRQEIKNYYGDPAGTGDFAPNSNYAKEASGVADAGERWLAARAHAGRGHKKAIVLDVDDTTLATYDYEVASNWDYNPATNADYVVNERFPAVPGMVDLVSRAKAEGYAVVFLTGRPQSQEDATLGNLEKVGYPAPTALPDATEGGGSDGIFTKPAVADYPSYLQFCENPTCNTDEYKSATRGYLESLGYDIVANFGDQYSDLSGGHEDRTFKLPNPSYFLP
ncbi:MAG TPA: HAD family acid phosphatase [Mycobacteriales bacterium]|nr:HAD family acid phosphatase [Mycobacteriales bacterium]